MGQSAKSRARRRQPLTGRLNLSVFPTACGWCGLVGTDNVVRAVFVGYRSADDVRRAADRRATRGAGNDDVSCTEHDWHPRLRQRLEQYCSGRPVAFDDISVALPRGTNFQQRVLELTRQIGYGQTATYGELAARAGHPRAARAVGTVMASNRLPILVPCHRVVASGGVGGYSSPRGVGLKHKLLAMEAEIGAVGTRARPTRRPGASRRRKQLSVR
jgi:methylated-DNA-[protein]-cysteine S-methyltransferase